MYTVSKRNLGRWLAVEITDPEEDSSFVIVPERGGCMLGLTFQGQQILDAYQDELDLRQLDWAKNTVLFPFPNRLKNGTYEFGDASYTFPINDKETGNALHGFGMWGDMEILSDMEEAKTGKIRVRYEDDGTRPFYAFPFEYIMTFEFEGPKSFKITQAFKNLGGRPMPLGFGWHPYFKLGEIADAFWLKMPTCKRVEMDEYMIPTGQLIPVDELQELHQIKDQQWDDCFALEITGHPVTTILKGTEGELHFWQETGPGKYNFLQLFTPPNRNAIAIEPMTCNVDAFNNEEGLIVLKPGESHTASFGIKMK